MQASNKKQQPKNKYDLQTRLLNFSKHILITIKSIPVSLHNKNILSQVIRSGTSIGANYTEANDALGKKDFLHRLRIARKEAKETIYWLELLITVEPDHKDSIQKLVDEAVQVRNILSAIINKST